MKYYKIGHYNTDAFIFTTIGNNSSSESLFESMFYKIRLKVIVFVYSIYGVIASTT